MIADVTVVGVGVIGLTSALDLADRGVSVRLVGRAHRGEASSASGGMLAPSIELEVVDRFARASRDRYPEFLAELEERTRIPVPLNRLGILEIAQNSEELDALRKKRGEFLSETQLRALEPTLQGVGGIRHPEDGCVDPLLLLDALRMAVARHPQIVVATEDVQQIRVSHDTCMVQTDGENWCNSGFVVIAAGAWSTGIHGLPSSLPIEPVRGQMVAFAGTPVRHVIYGGGGYIIPKADGTTMAGATMERVGFTPETTPEGIATVTAIGQSICPALRDVVASWAGLRPVTPDLLPVLGRDPEHSHVIYACGHSRNGVLLAPLTGEVVGDLVTGMTPKYDIHQFRVERF